MQIQEAKEVAASLARRRPKLVYSPHRYATWLLGRRVGQGTPLRELKASRHGRLLDNPAVRRIAAGAGAGMLTRQALEDSSPAAAEVYRIGFGTWGPARASQWVRRWYQTSRPGANVVVLVNFPPRHNAIYRRQLDPAGRLPMRVRHHPHARMPDLTLAWARVDIDLARGEALVEEIQSDWIRAVRWLWSGTSTLYTGADRDRAVQDTWRNPRASFDALDRYWTRVLAHHRAWWAEATLLAALWLFFEHFRIRRIYFHTPEGGVRWKGIRGDAPPRSIYTDLPRRFGFELTSEPPSLLEDARSEAEPSCGAGDLAWYRLDL